MRWRACAAAWRRRFVVPSDLVDPERAEQTRARLWCARWVLLVEMVMEREREREMESERDMDMEREGKVN